MHMMEGLIGAERPRGTYALNALYGLGQLGARAACLWEQRGDRAAEICQLLRASGLGLGAEGELPHCST